MVINTGRLLRYNEIVAEYSSPTAPLFIINREAKGNEETKFGAAGRFDYLVESYPATKDL